MKSLKELILQNQRQVLEMFMKHANPEAYESIKRMFPRASESFLAANPPLSPAQADKSVSRPSAGSAKARRGVMNKTEREYSVFLEAQKQLGAIHRWEFEGITLRWHGLRYTPDFVVFVKNSDLLGIKLIEVKGAFTKGKFERAIERFRHAKTYWPEFGFECHQKTKSGWKQIH